MGQLTVKAGVCAARLSRLEDDGTPVYGSATGAVVIAPGIMSLELEFEIEEGEEQFKRDSCGVAIISRKQDDTRKWVNFTLTMGQDDYRIYDIADIAQMVLDTGEIVGMAIDLGGGCEAGVAQTPFVLETWSQQFVCAAQADSPYQRVILPFCTAQPTSETRETDPSEPTLEGKSQSNPNFSDGPFGDLDVLDDPAYEQSGIFFLDDTSVPTPPSPFDYVTTPPEAS
jgi:hypothetical protein